MSPEALRLRAEAMGAVGEPTSMGSWWVPMIGGTRLDQIEAYAVESLHCALTHREPLIALRAWGQACQYLGELRGRCLHYSAYSDACMVARNRLEDFLRS